MNGYRKIHSEIITIPIEEMSENADDVHGTDEQMRSILGVIINHSQSHKVSKYEIIVRAKNRGDRQ